MQHTSSLRGFTLIEVLISVFILGMMLVFFTSAFSTNTLSRQTQRKDIAVRVLEQKLEELRADGYSSLPASGTFSSTLLDTLPSATASTSISDYNADIKLVTVGVSWIESSSSSQYIGVSTLITRVGGL